MASDEPAVAKAGSRCEVCGAPLTSEEMQIVLETGGPVLCAIHADEIVPIAEEDPGLGPAA